jgi:hypothetical protein
MDKKKENWEGHSQVVVCGREEFMQRDAPVSASISAAAPSKESNGSSPMLVLKCPQLTLQSVVASCWQKQGGCYFRSQGKSTRAMNRTASGALPSQLSALYESNFLPAAG